MTLVVDASVACKWFIEETDSDAAAQLLETGEAIAAPDLIISEVASALHKKRRSGLITGQQARTAIDELPGFIDELAPSVMLASRALEIADDLDHPIYDCFYVALAEYHRCRLITADKKLLMRLSRSTWSSTALGVSL